MKDPHVPHHLPKWAIPVGVGAAALLLLMRSKSGGGTHAVQGFGGAIGLPGGAPSPTSLAKSDGSLSQANNLLDQQIAEARKLQAGNQSLQASQVSNFTHLIANKSVACPNGGLPRLIPDSNSPTGLTYGCIDHKSGGLTFGSVLDFAGQAFGTVADYLGLAGGKPAYGGGYARTPGINGGSTRGSV